MLAVIYRGSTTPDLPLLPIAGRPLILRQLQWLRACGFDQVAVEVPDGADGSEVARCLQEDPLGWDVVPVATDAPLPPAEVARRAGFPEDVIVLGMQADSLGGGDLAQIYLLASSLVAKRGTGPSGDLVIQLPPPAFLPRPFGDLSLLLLGACRGMGQVATGNGWGTSVRCAADAIALGAAVLEGRMRSLAPWLLIHAAERSPGVWVARGGRIETGAKVVPPVLVGAGALVRSGAQIGPRVYLGDRAVVERGAVLADALVAPATIVGEGVTAESVLLTPAGIRHAERDGAFLPIEDPLILASRRKQEARRRLRLRVAGILFAASAAAVALAELLSGS
jgi:hypothetical protein